MKKITVINTRTGQTIFQQKGDSISVTRCYDDPSRLEIIVKYIKNNETITMVHHLGLNNDIAYIIEDMAMMAQVDSKLLLGDYENEIQNL